MKKPGLPGFFIFIIKAVGIENAAAKFLTLHQTSMTMDAHQNTCTKTQGY